jgi:hypothetical protein
MIRVLAGAFLVVHGVAHAVGFTSSWAMVASADAPYTTLILNGTVDAGDSGIRVIGVLWLLAAAGMIGAGIQVARATPGAVTVVLAASTFSLVMCVIGLPAAVAGVVIDLAILGGIWAKGTSDGVAPEAIG